MLGLRFPEFDYYRSVEPVFGDGEDPALPSCLGDAIDDLLDITHELQEAKWFRDQRSDAVGAALLAWSFDGTGVGTCASCSSTCTACCAGDRV